MMSRLQTGASIFTVLALALAGTLFVHATSKQDFTAQFTEAKGIYVGDNVTVLGVPVGKVTDIEPKRNFVVVKMQIDHGRKLPSDAKAAIVSKSLVSVRNVVIGPVYDGGPWLKPGATIPLSRTTVPVEFDEVKDELVRLTSALGPDGANKNGATSDLIKATSGFLDGKGEDINQTIKDLSRATQTLADNKGNTFATVRNLGVFVAALRSSDGTVRDFESNLAKAAKVLNANTDSITEGITAFKKLTTGTEGFFGKQGIQLANTLTSLQKVTKLVSDNRQSVADTLQLAPTAVSNFYNIIDPRDSAASGELALTSLGDPAYAICAGIMSLGGSTTDCRDALGPLVELLKVSAPPVGINVLSGSGVGPNFVCTPEKANILGKKSSCPRTTTKAQPASTNLLGLLGGAK